MLARLLRKLYSRQDENHQDILSPAHYDPPMRFVHLAWLDKTNLSQVKFTTGYGVPDIQTYLRRRQAVDIHNARWVLGVHMFSMVSDYENLLDWANIHGNIRSKILSDWQHRTAGIYRRLMGEQMQISNLAQQSDKNAASYLTRFFPISAKCGNGQLQYQNASIEPNILCRSCNDIHEENDDTNDEVLDSDTLRRNFWSLFCRAHLEDFITFKLRMDKACPDVSKGINWPFLIFDTCTDVSIMVYLFVMSVWQSRPNPKDENLADHVVMILAQELKCLVPVGRGHYAGVIDP